MKINVRTHNLEITKPLKDYAKKKLVKLDKYFSDIQEIQAELDLIDSAKEEESNIISVSIKMPGNLLRATEASKDMYASIDLVFDKLAKQLTKHKTKTRDHKKTSNKRMPDATTVKKTKKAINVEKNLFIPKPMGPEDAAILLEDKKLNFLVFRNIRTEKINVIYPTDNNEYGLIET
jgi:putative sigma-54 modulation protein